VTASSNVFAVQLRKDEDSYCLLIDAFVSVADVQIKYQQYLSIALLQD
jgi:hypothetical protein